jgi:hypothetical protein
VLAAALLAVAAVAGAVRAVGWLDLVTVAAGA